MAAYITIKVEPGEESPWIKIKGPTHQDTSAEDDSVASGKAIYATRAQIDQRDADYPEWLDKPIQHHRKQLALSPQDPQPLSSVTRQQATAVASSTPATVATNMTEQHVNTAATSTGSAPTNTIALNRPTSSTPLNERIEVIKHGPTPVGIGPDDAREPALELLRRILETLERYIHKTPDANPVARARAIDEYHSLRSQFLARWFNEGSDK
ncbi:MAG: hypothetical protein LQ346_004181 [Caloplaca aetnensis]|nr:MAG: hypothetical protein LQ346_004181 [Caloplaca aetnensis]